MPFPGPSEADLLSERVRQFRARHFPALTDDFWNDWQWQLAHRIRRLDQLAPMLELSADELQALDGDGGQLPLAVTPYYMGLLDPQRPGQPLRRSVIPSAAERLLSPGEADDPLHEEGHSPVPGVVHRYPDRLLLLATPTCAAYCRYCTRSRLVGRGDAIGPLREQWRRALDYIRSRPEVRDVLISGGDPLTLGDDALAWLLRELRQLPQIEIVRMGTKVPMVLPQRITAGLVRILRSAHPLWISIHVTHPDELTREASAACARLADGGIPLGSQTVLLRGINDDAAVMTHLMQRLLTLRVRPYYLYQCDPIRGSAHLRTPVERGLEIMRALQGHTSGYARPSFVIDAPGGGGKIPLGPRTVLERDGQLLLLRSHDGKSYHYPDVAPAAGPLERELR